MVQVRDFKARTRAILEGGKNRMGKTKLVLAAVLVLVFALAPALGALAAEGEIMSNELSAQSVAGTGVGIVVEKHATQAVVGMYDIFTVATSLTEGNPYQYSMVRVRVTVTGDTDGFHLEYLEQNPGNSNYGKFLTLPFEDGTAWYGPDNGFPLIDNTQKPSVFRVRWNQSGTYTFKIEVIKVDNNETLAETTATVSVAQGSAINLAWAAQPPASVAVNTAFEVGITADLTASASELDHTLYIIEVQKDGEAATKDDFTIVGNPEGIMDTFETVGNVLKGYWGPQQGFLFRQKTTSDFQVKFNERGTYSVKIYAIQVAPAESVEMADGLPAYFSWYYQ